MAPLFSTVDSNKLWHDVQHEENVICAQFGKDMFNISKVIRCKKVAQFFFDSQCIDDIFVVVLVLSQVLTVASDLYSLLAEEYGPVLVCVSLYVCLQYLSCFGQHFFHADPIA